MMDFLDFRSAFEREIYNRPTGKATSKTVVKILEVNGQVQEVMELEYETETDTLWIKVDG